MKKIWSWLGALALFAGSAFCFAGVGAVSAETEGGLKLYSGGGTEEVTFSRPEQYASANAANAVELLSTANPDGTTADGSTYFYERGLDCFILRGYTGYLYGAVNLTFANPIPDASKVKSMTMTLRADIFHGYDYDDIIYFKEEGNEVTIPYFRLHAVNADGSVNAETFFSFSTNNVPGQERKLEVTLNARDVRKLANEEGGIETLQWSVFTNQSTYFGFSYFNIYEITYELFDASDYHRVTFYDGTLKLGDRLTAYTAESLEGVSKLGHTAVWKTASGEVFDFSRPVTEDLSLYLNWAKQTCTLNFDSMGGSRVNAVSAEYGAAIAPPADPERPGYDFGGWYEDAACTIPYEFSEMGESRTLYAKWTRTAPNPPSEPEGCQAGASAGTMLAGAFAVVLCTIMGKKVL